MKVASRALYIAGVVYNALSIIVLIALSVFYRALGDEIYKILVKEYPDEEWITKVMPYISLCTLITIIIALLVLVVSLVLASVALYKSTEENKDKTPHILAIVAGGLSESPFLIVGGILGLIASRHE